jgi:lipopolysaccharide export system protein LptC
VRLLRIGVPAAVVVVFAGLALATWFNPLRMLAKLPIGVGPLSLSGGKVTMELPRLSGYTHDLRAYELTARTAAQDFTAPDRVELKEIRAKVEMQDKAVVEMQAETGLFDTKSEMLVLGDGIVIKSSAGYEGRLRDATIDMRKGDIVSDRPVELKLPNGFINANRLEVLNSGEVVRFDGGVTMMVTPPGADQQKSEKAGEP